MTLIEEIDEFLKDNPNGTSFEAEAVELLKECRDRLRWVPESIYIVEETIKWRSKHTEALPFACLTVAAAKQEVDKRHQHGKRWCAYCNAEWKEMEKVYDDDGAGVRLTIKEIPLIPQPPEQEEQEC